MSGLAGFPSSNSSTASRPRSPDCKATVERARNADVAGVPGESTIASPSSSTPSKSPTTTTRGIFPVAAFAACARSFFIALPSVLVNVLALEHHVLLGFTVDGALRHYADIPLPFHGDVLADNLDRSVLL